MPANLIIVTNVERVPALDSGDLLGFGMNIGVAWQGVDSDGKPKKPDKIDFVAPWTWAPIKRVRLQFLPDRVKPTDPAPALSAPIDVDVNLPVQWDPADLVKRLGEEYLKTSAEALRLPRATTRLKDDHPWAPRLLHLATYPYPIPQALNLSFLFKVAGSQLKVNGANQSTDGTLWAAPILELSGPFTALQEPVPMTSPLPEQGTWDYTGGAVEANVFAIRLTPPKDDFVNMQDQWIKVPVDSKKAVFEEDWQGQLEVRVAEAFRLPEFFTDFLRVYLAAPDGLFDQQDNLRLLSQMAMASIADAAGLGLTGASPGSGRSFAERLLAGAPLPMQPADWARFEAGAGNLYASIEQWTGLLKDALPVLANNGVLNNRSLTVAQTLDQLQRILDVVFAPDRQENLWKLFAAQWAKLLEPEPVALRAAILAEIAKQAAQPQLLYDLRARLACSHMDRFWNSFVKSNDGRDAGNTAVDQNGYSLIDVCFGKYVQYYGAVRFGATAPDAGTCVLPTTAPRFSPPPMSGLSTVFADALRTRLGARADLFRPRLRPDTPVPHGAAHGITVVLSKLESDSAAPVAGQQDMLQRISGVVGLMREVGAADSGWHCINYAEPWLAEKALVREPAVVPYRPYYRGGLKQASVTYENKSITADSPLNDEKMIEKYSGQLDYKDAFVRFRYCGASAPDQPPPAKSQTPGLKYGRQYQLCFFALTNTGVPPSGLADSAVPWKLKETIPGSLALPANTVLLAIYQRRINVGPLRLFAASGASPASGAPTGIQSAPAYPAIPASVRPRVREYETFNPAAGDFAPVSSERDCSVVLLCPDKWLPDARGNFAMDVRPPTIAWNTWDRWVSGESGVQPEDRWKLIASVFRKSAAAGLALQSPNLQPDDPAVQSRIWIELREIGADGTLLGADKSWSGWAEFNANSTRTRNVPAGAIRVECHFDQAQHGLKISPSVVAVTVKKGSMYRLALMAAIPEEKPSGSDVKRFADNTLPAAQALPDGNFHLVSPTFLAIEAATDTMPKPEVLWGAVRCTLQLDVPTRVGSVRAELDPFRLSATDRDSCAYVQRAVVRHQAWRWNGRPPFGHPALTAGNSIGDWDAWEFGERPEEDRIPHPMPVVRQTPGEAPERFNAGIRTFRYEFSPQDTKGRYDDRGQHHRFGVTAYSRYEGLIPSASRDAIQNPGTPTENRWNALFVPSLNQGPLPAPRVRLILPLTQSDPEGRLAALAPSGAARLATAESTQHKRHTAGLLVVLNEPWFQTGGIGEGLEARVEMAASPYAAPGAEFFYQLGPDVTARKVENQRLFRDPVKADDRTVTFESILGPVGHYFDADNNTALMVGTSFILPPPSLPADKDGPMDWYFARVAFRRSLATRSPVGLTGVQEYPPVPPAVWPLRSRYSPFTAPVWVQFLPEFSIFNGFEEHVSSLLLTFVGNIARLIQPADGAVAKLAPTTGAVAGEFQLYLVLTRKVVDVIGRPDQEAYLGLFHQGANGDWVTSDPVSPRQGQAYRARLIEVQRPVIKPGQGEAACWPSSPPADLWDELFRTPVTAGRREACDALARIVRISEPIDSRPPSGACGD